MHTNDHIDNIIWLDNLTPKSLHFDDIYFSHDDAIAESQYVFIEGNQLNQRFLAHQEQYFTVGETGFGSGLNFLLIWQLFLQFRAQYPHHPLKSLHFISVEKYPLRLDELEAVHLNLFHDPDLINLAVQLRSFWETSHHQFDSAVLDLFWGDITCYSDYLTQQNSTVDAWFFDGFSPAKNPDMWSSGLFSELYNMTKSQGTFATFTAAGQVRRNLIEAGFQVDKRKGYHKKREMLVGKKI